MNARPLPPGWTRPPVGTRKLHFPAPVHLERLTGAAAAADQPGNRDERRRICAHPTGMSCRCFEPAPSAGQDTEQLRDEPSLLPLLVTGSLAEHAVACNGCGGLVLNNPNAVSAHRDWHRRTW